MSEPTVAENPANAGAAFFGFMGVSMALVLASTLLVRQTSVLHMALLRPALASVAYRFGALEWS